MLPKTSPSDSRFIISGLMLAVVLLAGPFADAVTIDVVDSGGSPVSGFRWLVEEDTTYDVIPGVRDPYTLATRFHASYMPVVASGHSDASTANLNLPADKRYFVSVLPDAGHGMGGAQVAYGQTDTTVTVNMLPTPTAQISVFVFHDNHPLNNAPDDPEEVGLAGFKITVVEAGGRFGASGGQMMTDAFGNMLGTTYDKDGNVVMMGDGTLTTDADGMAYIKNLSPGKYTLFVVPPAGQQWQQTATIEGTRGIDAWVKANEPRFFAEFGPPGEHVFVGFIQPTNDASVLTGGGAITGTVVNLHTARPPDYSFFPSWPFPGAWVGLNEFNGGQGGRCVFAAPCDDSSSFTIPNVPAGSYVLSVWDENLDIIFANLNVTMPASGDLELGNVPVFAWFHRMENHVFNDTNENGFWDDGEPPISDVTVNLRWRDGTLYQTMTTDLEGAAPFEEVFPFFSWLVAEVDFARNKATGATFVIDDGGAVLPHDGWNYPSFDVLTPQPQTNADGSVAINPNTGNDLSRTEVGPVLTQGFQGFLGQTNVALWGKSTYDYVDVDHDPKGNFPGVEDVDHNANGLFDPGNGGISGMVHYASTRAEDDPRFAAAEPWEPGIPRVQVNLYGDYDADGVIDDRNADGIVTPADVDNYPFEWREPTGAVPIMGPEDVDHNGNGEFDFGDAMNITATDSWDDSPPTNAQGPPFVHHGVPTDAYDGLRNFNQLRPAVFDGGYAFMTPTPDSVESIPEGTYIVEVNVPPGYELQKEEDINVVFGETYVPAEKAGLLLPARCVGDLREVPEELSLFPGTPCTFANQMRPLPDRKQVVVSNAMNAACNFFLFTEVPIAGHILGFILDDLSNEFDPNAPTFGEKYAPPWLPISIRDYAGNEISRTYSDQWGVYNALVPSTFTFDRPFPSGAAPNMLTVVLNSPGPILDTRPGSPTHGQYITDPYFNRQYSQFSYTFQYMPGTTTYLDTPVVPVAAFAGPDQYPLDSDLPDGIPVVWSVENGPYVEEIGDVITIASAGKVGVPNPLYTLEGSEPKTILRDYGFGEDTGTVTINGVALTDVTWTDGAISGTVAPGTTTGQLEITRADGVSSLVGVTVTVGEFDGDVHRVGPSADPLATPIQDAIDAAEPNDLILVAPGTYNELVIMWKPVQLQGWGAFSTVINAVKVPAEKLQAWRDKVKDLIVEGHVDLLPSQEVNFAGIEPDTLFTEEGPGIMVLARNTSADNGGFGASPRARIDGLYVTGADHAGGIVVNGYARHLQISNNRLTGNQGIFGGGIRVGHPTLLAETPLGLMPEHGRNEHLLIYANLIAGNGGLGEAGGGIALYTGTDDYTIEGNWISGNFTMGNGAGIGHMGLSNNGRIIDNFIVFNQTFNQSTSPSGGGIFIGGGPAPDGLTPGAGSVTISGNLIQGNHAGAGDGGGIRLEAVNGQDVEFNPTNPDAWYAVRVANNIIVNNVSGLAGGGLSLVDTVNAEIVHNTIAHNDSTATAGVAFEPGSPTVSAPQPAGVVARAHSAQLADLLEDPAVDAYSGFSNPLLTNNIIWQNRSFHFSEKPGETPPFGLEPDPASPVYADLAVLGGAAGAALNPMGCVLTDASGYHSSNITADPQFIASYFNGDRGQTVIIPEVKTPLAAAPAFDEGGNFIDVRYGPLTLVNPATGMRFGDYHLSQSSPAIDAGSALVFGLSEMQNDYDGQPRPNGGYDIGADEAFANGNDDDAAVVGVDDTFTLGVFIIGIKHVPRPGVLANDYSSSGLPLRAELVSGPRNGLLVLNPNGSFTYITAFFAGNDRFTYVATDGINTSEPVRVTLRIRPAGNARPVTQSDAYATEMNTLLEVPAPGVLANDQNGGDTLIAQLRRNVRYGDLDLAPDGGFVYQPDENFFGTDSFQYVANDGMPGNIATVVITVAATEDLENLPPDPKGPDITTVMGETGIGRVLPNDPNFDDYHTFEITVPPEHGSAAITQTGIVTYAPDDMFMGEDSLTVTVTDQDGATGSVMVGIMVTHMTMPPSSVALQCPPDTDGIDTDGDGIADNDNVCVHLGAGDGFVTMADGRTLYMFGFSDLTGKPVEQTFMAGMLAGESPGPTIAVREGQKLYINLTNVGMAMRPDLFDPHSVHFHGFPQASSVFDGMPDGSISINMGGTLTYFYNIVEPGTFMYHCHVEATEHMQMGMLGNLYVTPKQDGNPFEYPAGSGKVYTTFAYNDGDGSTGYDVGYPIQLGSFDANFHDASWTVQPLPFALMRDDYSMLNGRGYPDTVNPNPLAPPDENGGKVSQKVSTAIHAEHGERILLRLSNLNVTQFHTLTSGIPMQVVGHDARLLRGPTGQDLYYETNSVTLGGGESYDVILDTSKVSPGTYLLYSTNLHCLSNGDEDFGGMMTEIVVE